MKYVPKRATIDSCGYCKTFGPRFYRFCHHPGKRIGMKKYFKAESRSEWFRDTDNVLSDDDIKLGAILRIADAVEVMAKRYNDLISDRDHWKNKSSRNQKELDTERRRSAALRGLLKRLKGNKGE